MGFGSGVRRARASASACRTAATASALDAGQPQRGGAGQAAVPHHHPGLPHQGRPAGDELRRDGRQHAAAGPPADAGAHARLRPEPAGRLRRAALALQRRAERQRRGRDEPRHRAGPDRARPPHRASSTTATRTSAPASSSGASATRPSKATWRRAIRAATGWPPVSNEAPCSPEMRLCASVVRAHRSRPAGGHFHLRAQMKVTKAKGLNTIWLAAMATTHEQGRFDPRHPWSRMHRDLQRIRGPWHRELNCSGSEALSR